MISNSKFLSEIDVERLVALVRKTGREIVMPYFRNLDPSSISTKSDPTDLVTIADIEAEAALSAGAQAILSGCKVVGEEAVAKNAGLLDQIGEAEICVIIDPVDGTFNFARGIAVFGIILAVTHYGETIFGLLYDPVMDDWVMARQGKGAVYCNANGLSRNLATRKTDILANAEGTVPLDLLCGDARAKVLEAIEPARNARSLRCSCHEYRMLAMGQADFSLNATTNPWDHAAGVLVLQEAGGHVELRGGKAYRPTSHDGWIMATGTPEIASELRRIDWANAFPSSSLKK